MEPGGHTSWPNAAMIAELPEVWEPDDADVARIFEEIPMAVGVPGVHLLWRRLANHPAFLAAIWPGAAAALRSAELEAGAERLRSVAFIVEAVGMPSHKAFRGDLVRAEIDAGFREKIEHFNDLSQAGLSRLLVLVASLRRERASRTPPGRAAGLPAAGPPIAGAIYVPPFRDGEAVGKAREILDRVEREHCLAFLDDYYRSLARVPEYLAAAWNAIRPIVGDPVYLARSAELARLAAEAGSQLSVASGAAAALQRLDPREAAAVREALKLFAERVLPQTLIDVTLIKALTSGPQRATVFAI